MVRISIEPSAPAVRSSHEEPVHTQEVDSGAEDAMLPSELARFLGPRQIDEVDYELWERAMRALHSATWTFAGQVDDEDALFGTSIVASALEDLSFPTARRALADFMGKEIENWADILLHRTREIEDALFQLLQDLPR